MSFRLIVCKDTSEEFTEYKDYLKSEHWRLKKEAFYASLAEIKCANCKATKSLHVHHTTYVNIGDEDLADLVCLCKECHARAHGLIEPVKKKHKAKLKKSKKVKVTKITQPTQPKPRKEPVTEPPKSMIGYCECCKTKTSLMRYRLHTKAPRYLSLCESCLKKVTERKPDIPLMDAYKSYQAFLRKEERRKAQEEYEKSLQSRHILNKPKGVKGIPHSEDKPKTEVKPVDKSLYQFSHADRGLQIFKKIKS